MKKFLCVAALCGSIFGCSTYHDDVNDFTGPDEGQDKVELVTREMNGQQVVLEKIDGQLIFEGDIVIDEGLLDSETRGAGITPTNYRKWPENYVNYVIDPSIPSTSVPVIKAAMKEWQLNSNLLFVPRERQPNYIKFVSSTVNNSYVGMVGGQQIINLHNHNNKGVVMHEIGHALGLWHEQTRRDRDRYITINWSNIEPEKRSNFNIYDSGMDYGPFDFNSIMLYDSYDFAIDQSIPVMTKKSDGTTFTNQRLYLSDGDKYAIQTMYARLPVYGDANYIPCPADYDGDGKADLSVKNRYGYWLIDYAVNGFGKWDDIYKEWGESETHAAPADFDGDGKADMSVKADWKDWYIDYSRNGFNGIDNVYTKDWGTNTAHAVAADFDGDGKADLSVKADWKDWYIDYSSNGFNGIDNVYTKDWGTNTAHAIAADFDGDGKADLSVKADWGSWYIDYSANGFKGIDNTYYNWGGVTAYAFAADFDGDGKADMSVRDNGGNWYVDYARNGFNGIDNTYTNRGGKYAHPAPADYDGDGKADLSIKTDAGEWYIDYARNGFNGWDSIF